MHLLPYDTLTLQTPDPLPLVIEKLYAHIEPQKTFRWTFSRNHKAYEGTVSETGFTIHRIIHHRNSFLPVIRGRFEVSPAETRVHITMRLHPAVVVFLSFWYLIWYSFTIPVWLTGAMPEAFALQFMGLPIAILVIFWSAFWTEAYRSRRDLSQIFLGQPLPNSGSWIPTAVQWSVFSLVFLIQIKVFLFPSFFSFSSNQESWEAVSCSHNPAQSPYCNFSNTHTFVGHPSATTLALSADGQTLVSGGEDKAIKVWDLKTGQLRKTLQSDSGRIRSLAIAPDGKTVVSGSADHRVRIWSLSSNQPPRILVGHTQDVNQVKITPDGQSIISGSYGAIKVWDLTTGQLKTTFPSGSRSETKVGPISVVHDQADRFNPLAINAISNTVLISDRQIIDLNSHQIRDIPKGQGDHSFAYVFLSGYLSLDGQLEVLEYGNSFKKFETRLKVRNLASGLLQGEALATFSHHTFAHTPLAFSRDHIFGSTGKQLKIWNLDNLRLEAVVETGWMQPLVVSADGKVLAGLTHSPNVAIKVWQQ